MQWYFHSRALSCWALYLRNNVMYTVSFLQVSTMLSGGSTGVPRQYFEALDWLEQRYDGLGKDEPLMARARFHRASAGRNLLTISVHALKRPGLFQCSHLDEEALELAKM